jgi:SAM-dependent methyltransferase
MHDPVPHERSEEIRTATRRALVLAMRRRAVTMKELAELKRDERAMWARGDYAAIARDMFWDVGARIVDRVGVRPGDRVLDVACGTGNAAIRAAAAGGEVVGVDLTPELFEAGRKLAAEAGVEVEWVEGDAETLPAEDKSFDVVLSVFGCMFAPRHEVAARELARVLRPGGLIGLCSWTPDSSIAALMRTLMGSLPAPPEFAKPPPLWGSDEHVRGLFEGSGIELEFERDVADFRFGSVEDALHIYETTWGPFIEARELLEPQGRWPAVRCDLAGVLERRNASNGTGLQYASDYLVVIGRR